MERHAAVRRGALLFLCLLLCMAGWATAEEENLLENGNFSLLDEEGLGYCYPGMGIEDILEEKHL